MKNKKILAITLVTILTFASISIVNASELNVKTIPANRTSLVGLSDLISILFNKIATILSKIGISRPSEIKVPDSGVAIQPKLAFYLDLEKQYKLGDPIDVDAILTNQGRRTVCVDEMNFRCKTIDFSIRTPNGEIHYIGDNSGTPECIKILAGDSYTLPDVNINDKTLFGNNSMLSAGYFKLGNYTITGYYMSGRCWDGNLKTETYEFEIVS